MIFGVGGALKPCAQMLKLPVSRTGPEFNFAQGTFLHWLQMYITFHCDVQMA